MLSRKNRSRTGGFEIDPSRDRAGSQIGESGRWQYDLGTAIEEIGRIGRTKPVGGEGGALNCAIIPIATGIIGIAVERIIGNQSIGEKSLAEGGETESHDGEQNAAKFLHKLFLIQRKGMAWLIKFWRLCKHLLRKSP